MKTKRSSRALTRKDLRHLATKKDLHDLRIVTQKDMQAIKKEILDGVSFLNENLLHDFQGAFKDRTEQLRDRVSNHEDRLQRLEGRAMIV